MTHLPIRILVFTALIIGISKALPLSAAIPPLSPQQLKKQATDIFTGTVTNVRSSDQKSKRFKNGSDFVDRIFTITVRIQKVDKSATAKAGSIVTIEAWQPLGGGVGLLGPQGNVPIPAKDDAITVYSTQPKERQRTETSPDSRADAIVYVPLLPNGLVINKQNRGTPRPATTTPPQPNSDDAIDNQTRINLQRFSNASSYQFMATFALFKEMLENEWDEKLFRQFEFYERLNQQAVSSYQEQYQDDKTWGPWFRKKGTFQQENFKKLVPYIQKRRKGEALSPDDMGSLLQLQRQITAQLGK